MFLGYLSTPTTFGLTFKMFWMTCSCAGMPSYFIKKLYRLFETDRLATFNPNRSLGFLGVVRQREIL